MRPTLFRHPEHRFTSLLALFDSVEEGGEAPVSLLIIPVARPDRSGDLEKGPDLWILSAENLRTEGPPVRPAEEEVVGAEEAVEAVVEVVVEEEEEEEALKHFWHMLLVAGLPAKPQLLTQRVKASGTLNSVSSFSVL